MYSILSLTESTRFIFLPQELLLHIISFNEKSAAKLIQKKAKIMLTNKINAFQSMMKFGFRSRVPLGLGVTGYSLFYKNRIVSSEEIVETFSKCECCERHKINRPKNLAPWVETTFHGTVKNICPCNCRQFSRMICRKVN
jgi:hypothetical protein